MLRIGKILSRIDHEKRGPTTNCCAPDYALIMSILFRQKVLHHPKFIGGLSGCEGNSPPVRVESQVIQIHFDVDLPGFTAFERDLP